MLIKVLAFLVAVAATGLLSGPAATQDLLPAYLEMTKGQVQIVRTEQPFKNAIIGDGDVLNSYPLGETVAAITAQREGQSSLVFVDDAGEVVARAEIRVSEAERAGRDVVSVHGHVPGKMARVSLEYLCDPFSGCLYASSNPQIDPISPSTVNVALPGSTLAPGATLQAPPGTPAP